MMCKKLIVLTFCVFVLTLVGTNTVFGSIVVERGIASGNDDTEAKVDGGADRGSSDLEMPYEGDGATGDKQIIGLRFLDIPFEKGEQVSNAYIQFTGDNEKLSGDTVNLIINGLLQINPPEFGSDEQFYKDRNPKTNAEVKWSNIPAWTSSQVTEASTTPDISPIINEIINQDGWTKGDALIICIRDDETNPSTDIRSALANGAAKLVFEIAVPYATEPNPADGTLLEDTWTTLLWEPGMSAVSHDVYLGDNYENVLAGTEDTFLGNQSQAMVVTGFPGYSYPDGLVPGTTYYWRIDEVEADGTVVNGDIWSFSVPSKTAYNPSPPDGGKYVDPEVQLSWTAGHGSKLHTVYFGDNFDDVSNASGGVAQVATTFTPGTLEMDKTYYWRVDEFDVVQTHKGNVWSFTTLGTIAITDPNLIGWWNFDAGSGNTVLDLSGYGNDGTLGGDPQKVEGIVGMALELDGSDYVAIDGVVDDIANENITLNAWIKTRQASEGNVFASNDSSSSHPFMFGVQSGNPFVNDSGDTQFPPAVNDDQWHMITYVRSGSRGNIYVDAVLIGTYSPSFSLNTVTRWSIGQEWDGTTPSDFYVGLVDEVRFYKVPLTQTQIAELMRGDPLVAWNPMPSNNSTVVIKDARKPLAWSPGDDAAGHDVYFGPVKKMVTDADASDTTGIYQGKQSSASYTLPPDNLEWGGGPYFWRVDEINSDGSVSTGAVWSFSVADYLVVDDFESYNDLNVDDPESNRIFYTWLDGYDNPAVNGSVVGYANPPFVELSIVHGGRQSMPVIYDNGVGLSEATMTLTDQRNWTEEGVGVLTIWFRGEPGNALVPLYVALNGNAVVTHSDPAATQVTTWTRWDIDLQAFADQGVNLTNVDTITLGFGNKSNPTAGGAGTMYFDDIRLYRPAQ